MSLKIDTSFPGGNVFLENIDGFEVLLAKDLRNTTTNWFYWAFRCTFGQPGEYHFRFTNGTACGSRGPAISHDGGFHWEWLGENSLLSGKHDEFRYLFQGTPGEQVIFCTGMQYQQVHLDDFLERYADSPFLSTSVLAYTRKNRAVELLHVEDTALTAAGKKYIFLASRHHCCEMMATCALEGILEAALGDNALGKDLRRNFIFEAVPFTDKDGVVDGDQGKNRRPHDHARDYTGKPIYPEIRAIQERLREKHPFLALDLHCPWLFGSPENESVYFPGESDKTSETQLLKFSAILEQKAPPEAPFFAKDNILYGTSWNTEENFKQGTTMTMWVINEKLTANAFAIEIPYANIREITLTQNAVRALGGALAKTILRFATEEKSF